MAIKLNERTLWVEGVVRVDINGDVSIGNDSDSCFDANELLGDAIDSGDISEGDRVRVEVTLVELAR